MKMGGVLVLAEFGVISLIAAGMASWFTTRAMRTWYPSAPKPQGTPPLSSFKPLWIGLHFLLGVAAWNIWLQRGWGGSPVAYEIFFAQLILVVVWAALFFGLRRPAAAFAAGIALWLSVFATDLAFWKISGLSGFLELVYLIWAAYVLFLNFSFWRMNRNASQRIPPNHPPYA